MDFDQLTTFVFVAKLKSFSRAGQKVFRSQSAVSAQIRQLEQAYKARLLDRSAKSVELTPAGEVLFEYAEKLLRMRDHLNGFVAPAKKFLGVFEQDFTGGSQLHGLGGAVE